MGRSERTALKHVYYQVWNRSPVQVGCVRQVLRAGALGWPRGMGWRGWWEGGSGWGTHVNPWLIHVNVWQKPLQYCKVISLQLIKINKKKNSLQTILLACLFSHVFKYTHPSKEKMFPLKWDQARGDVLEVWSWIGFFGYFISNMSNLMAELYPSEDRTEVGGNCGFISAFLHSQVILALARGSSGLLF